MELEQKYIKKQNKKLNDIIKEVFLVDINEKSRTRNSVDARIAYSKILRDHGYTYEDISKTLKKNHATVIYYIKTIENLIKFDPIFNKKYILCKKRFLDETDIKFNKREIDLFMDYIKMYFEENKSMPSLEYCQDIILKKLI
jgi:hypothetical protein